MHLHPGKTPQTRWPRHCWGLQRLAAIWRAEKDFHLHHIFNPDPFDFPMLRFLRRPVVYSAVGGSAAGHGSGLSRLARRVARLVVPSESDCRELRLRGLSNTAAIAPGIDTTRFAAVPPPPGPPWTLLVGSAPWTEEQFESKGVKALLSTAQQRSDLRLVFLWRGVLLEAMERRVREAGLGHRVEVLDRRVDVVALLARTHAGVVLAERPSLVKAFPHSLLESLAAGRPILVSEPLAMADYVSRHGCGVVAPTVNETAVHAATNRLLRSYESCRQRALAVRAKDFGLERFLASYDSLHREVLSPRG
jgi:glycosyltransferase involved in cell wall biosynthesis